MRAQKRLYLLLLGCIFATSNIYGQSESVLLHLSKLSPVLPSTQQGIVLPHPAQSGFLMQIGLTRVVWDSLDGNRSVEFDIKRVPKRAGLPDEAPHLLDYTTLPSSGYVALIQWMEGGHKTRAEIAEFDSNGLYNQSIPINIPDFAPFRLAVFESGYFLLEGGKPFSSEGGISRVEEFILDGMGTVETQIPVAVIENSSSPNTSAGSAKHGAQREASSEENLYKSLGGEKENPDASYQALEIAAARALFCSGDDGYIYAYWPNNPGKLEKISQDGTVEAVNLGKKKDEGDIFSFEESSGQVAVARTIIGPVKDKPGVKIYKSMSVEVYNIADSASPVTYTLDTPALPVMLGFAPGNFYFLKGVMDDSRGKFFIARFTP